MSIPKISGQQARNLLDGTIDGPWSVEVHKRYDIIVSPVGYAVAYNEDNPEDGRANSELLAAAPALAETVAWLYGREADEFGHQSTDTEHIYVKRGQVVYVNDDPYREGKDYLTPEEAVDRARALLTAAEEARP